MRDVPQGRYVALGPARTTRLVLKREPPAKKYIHLRQSNASALRWETDGTTVQLRLRGHVPVMFEIASSAEHCGLYGRGPVVRGKRNGDVHRFELKNADTGERTLRCR